jgi:hypothetical protein
VAYDLEIPDHITVYLEELRDRDGIGDKIEEAIKGIKNLSAEFRADAMNRYPGSTLLRYGHLFMNEEGRNCCITFAIDDRPAVHGVLRIPHVVYKVGAPFLPPDDSSDS